MKNIPGQVGDELGELLKSVGSETVKAPGAIAGEAIPGGKSSASPQQPGESVQKSGKRTPLDELTETDDRKRQQEIARRALGYLARPVQTPEPSVRERLDREAALKRQEETKEAEKAAQMAPVAVPKGKKRGDLFGPKQSTEKNPNVRQD